MTTFSFTDRERDQFERDGYIIVRGLARADECSALLAVAQAQLAQAAPPAEYEADTHYPGAPSARSDTGGGTIRRLLQAYARHAAFRAWATDARIAGRLHQLLGPDIVMPQAHHNCIMTKQPHFSSVTGWHQDVRYWSYTRPELVSVWLPLVRETPENGCLMLIPGTHRMAFAPEQVDARLFLREDLPQNRTLIAGGITAELNPGDVLFFHARTFHAAGRNTTDETKFSLVFTYRSADNQPLAGTRSAAMPDITLR